MIQMLQLTYVPTWKGGWDLAGGPESRKLSQSGTLAEKRPGQRNTCSRWIGYSRSAAEAVFGKDFPYESAVHCGSWCAHGHGGHRLRRGVSPSATFRTNDFPDKFRARAGNHV